jgi:hypothetical protein
MALSTLKCCPQPPKLILSRVRGAPHKGPPPRLLSPAAPPTRGRSNLPGKRRFGLSRSPRRALRRPQRRLFPQARPERTTKRLVVQLEALGQYSRHFWMLVGLWDAEGPRRAPCGPFCGPFRWGGRLTHDGARPDSPHKQGEGRSFRSHSPLGDQVRGPIARSSTSARQGTPGQSPGKDRRFCERAAGAGMTSAWTREHDGGERSAWTTE